MSNKRSAYLKLSESKSKLIICYFPVCLYARGAIRFSQSLAGNNKSYCSRSFESTLFVSDAFVPKLKGRQ